MSQATSTASTECFFNGCTNSVMHGSWKCEFHKNRAKCTGSSSCHNQVFARNLCVRHGGKS
ncbi:hypothetical protein SPRG_18562, partial [Saprolegnia parasitica CBS 223.65]